MLIDTSLTIAYKCCSCGTYDFSGISVFKLTQKKEMILNCRCKKSSVLITIGDGFRHRIVIPCIACGKDHSYVINMMELLSKHLDVFYCPNTGIQLCFIGNDIQVRSRIDTLEQEQDEMINTLGYDNYFKNTRVMFDSLNHIHDIAEQGNLICECGSSEIELMLLSDKIQLKCSKCPGNNIILAASNEDLKNILRTQLINLKVYQNTM